MKRPLILSIYGDDTLKAKFEKIKSSYVERNPGIPMSDSAAGAILIDNEYQKIMGGQTNANRITTIVEELRRLTRAVKELLSQTRNQP